MAARKRFYTSVGEGSLPSSVDPYRVECFRPRLSRLRPAALPDLPPLALHLFWYLASRSSYEIYVVRTDEAIVHTSYLLSKNVKFAFMGARDLEIGPCWTHHQHRGRGIYPAILSRIRKDHPAKRLWIFCDEDNLSSRKGIERAGFTFAGTGLKRRGIYRIDDPARR